MNISLELKSSMSGTHTQNIRLCGPYFGTHANTNFTGPYFIAISSRSEPSVT